MQHAHHPTAQNSPRPVLLKHVTQCEHAQVLCAAPCTMPCMCQQVAPTSERTRLASSEVAVRARKQVRWLVAYCVAHTGGKCREPWLKRALRPLGEIDCGPQLFTTQYGTFAVAQFAPGLKSLLGVSSPAHQ
jgi:hypothetical protein